MLRLLSSRVNNKLNECANNFTPNNLPHLKIMFTFMLLGAMYMIFVNFSKYMTIYLISG